MRHAYEKDAKKPRIVFTSSIAVFGAPFPEKIPDEFHHTPLTSYGTQKAIGELLLADYTRKGMLDGIGIRLPTICVRPGKPNKAASGFFSNICREPLAGHEAVLPVSDDVMHWHASPRAAVGFLQHAATIDGEKVGTRRNLTMPGLGVTIGGQIEALRKVGGEKVVKRIRREPDPFIQKIVAGWPTQVRCQAGHGPWVQIREDVRGDRARPRRGRIGRQNRLSPTRDGSHRRRASSSTSACGCSAAPCSAGVSAAVRHSRLCSLPPQLSG